MIYICINIHNVIITFCMKLLLYLEQKCIHIEVRTISRTKSVTIIAINHQLQRYRRLFNKYSGHSGKDRFGV